MPKTDPRVTKRRVTMRNRFLIPGTDAIQIQEAIDYVRPDFLDAYVEDAKTRWMEVEVSDKPDAGPGGYEGQTFIPAVLSGVGEDITVPAERG